MLDRLTVDSFAPLVGERFAVVAPGLDGFALELLTAETFDDAPAVNDAGARSPFRLTFRGPGTGILTQGTYRLEHETMRLDIFIVPLAPDAGGPVYEAIFA